MTDVTTPTQPGATLREAAGPTERPATARPTVVIVGAGFGGPRAARALRKAPADVILLARRNYHPFQPLLYQVAPAGLAPGPIAQPVRADPRRPGNFGFPLGGG